MAYDAFTSYSHAADADLGAGCGGLTVFECDACLALPDLTTLARARATRALTPGERLVLLGER